MAMVLYAFSSGPAMWNEQQHVYGDPHRHLTSCHVFLGGISLQSLCDMIESCQQITSDLTYLLTMLCTCCVSAWRQNTCSRAKPVSLPQHCTVAQMKQNNFFDLGGLGL